MGPAYVDWIAAYMAQSEWGSQAGRQAVRQADEQASGTHTRVSQPHATYPSRQPSRTPAPPNTPLPTHQCLCAHFNQCVQLALVATQPGGEVAVKQQARTLCVCVLRNGRGSGEAGVAPHISTASG